MPGPPNSTRREPRRTPLGQRHKSPALTTADLDHTVVDPSPLSSCPPMSSIDSPSSPLTAQKNSSTSCRAQDATDIDDEDDSGFATAQEQPSDEPPPSSFVTSSFGSSSQRVMKKGHIVVTNSDSDTDSDSTTIESPEELLAKFMPPAQKKSASPHVDGAAAGRTVPLRGNASKNGHSRVTTESPKYSFSIDELLEHSVDDNEMQANVIKARASMEQRQADVSDGRSGKAKHDAVLEAAVDGHTDAGGIQRLKDAVHRTEVFDRNKSWSFFDDTPRPPSPLKFPQMSIPPGFWGGILRDPDARERAFFSGLVGESWSDCGLPDELILWLFHAVTVEPRDDLRYAYCSSLKLLPSGRLTSLINPSHINQMFRRLGAKSSALAIKEPVRSGDPEIQSNKTRDYRHLLSVLDVISGLANKFNDNVREHCLKLLLRLTLDEARMDDGSVCVATQDGITSLLRESDTPLSDLTLFEISLSIFKTVQDVTLQAHLLMHILPTTPQMSLFRSRLALSFLFRDESPLGIPPEHLLNLKRITAQLDDPRFDTSRKAQMNGGLDFWSFSSLIFILSVAIDSGTPATLTAPGSRPPSPDTAARKKAAEEQFNAEVDRLADRIKALFSSIQDSGASHLKRTEAKESLQVLHYRLIHSVRTKPRPKKSWLSHKGGGLESWSSVEKSRNTMERFVEHRKRDKKGAEAQDEQTGTTTTSGPREE